MQKFYVHLIANLKVVRFILFSYRKLCTVTHIELTRVKQGVITHQNNLGTQPSENPYIRVMCFVKRRQPVKGILSSGVK